LIIDFAMARDRGGLASKTVHVDSVIAALPEELAAM
jgi:hypothetical protein